MKSAVISILLGCLAFTNAFSQAPDIKTRADSILGRQLGRILRYPAEAHRHGQVAQVYASFTISQRGKLEQLTVLNMSDVNNVFRKVVADALAKLPEQSPNLAGTYLLPVVFELEGRDGMKKPPEEERQQVRQQAKQTVLNEVHVVGYSTW